jgi:hypothetical protein
MSLLARSDLVYTYDWTAAAEHDNPKITGKPDSALFSRHEGYEVLYLINHFAETHGYKQKATGLKLEKLIRVDLPSGLHSRKHVLDWLSKQKL